MENKLPKNYSIRLKVLDKDLQEKVKRAVDKEKTLNKCEVISNERNKEEFKKEHYILIGQLPKADYNRIFFQEKWNSDINFVFKRLEDIKKIIKDDKEKRQKNKEIKKLDAALITTAKPPLKLKINGKLTEHEFFIFNKTDSQDITEKKWEVIKTLSDRLKGDIVRIFRLLTFYEIPINKEKRGKNEYMYGVKNLNLKKRRIYISKKSEFDLTIAEYKKRNQS